MAVLVVTQHVQSPNTALCVICFQKIPLTEVTAGSRYADGKQAFACNIHLHDRTRWILEWTKFDSHQRLQKEITNIAEILW
jgi:hypothetical protein